MDCTLLGTSQATLLVQCSGISIFQSDSQKVTALTALGYRHSHLQGELRTCSSVVSRCLMCPNFQSLEEGQWLRGVPRPLLYNSCRKWNRPWGGGWGVRTRAHRALSQGEADPLGLPGHPLPALPWSSPWLQPADINLTSLILFLPALLLNHSLSLSKVRSVLKNEPCIKVRRVLSVLLCTVKHLPTPNLYPFLILLFPISLSPHLSCCVLVFYYSSSPLLNVSSTKARVLSTFVHGIFTLLMNLSVTQRRKGTGPGV